MACSEGEDLRALSVQVAEFRLHVENQLAEVVRLLENSKLKERSEPPVSAGGSFRNSLLNIFTGSTPKSNSFTGSDPPMDSIEEAEEESDASCEKTKTRKTELFFQSRSSTSSSKSSRHSFVRKSTVAHRQRAQSQAQKLRSVRVSMHLMPQPSMEPRQRSLKYYANKIVSSGAFAYTITFFILLNVILLGIEVDYSASVGQFDIPDWFNHMNTVIVLFFVLEIVLKFMALGCWDFWFGEDATWNFFEFLIIIVSVVDVALDFVTTAISSNLNTGQLRLVRSIRLARALRSMRVMRLFRYVSALRTLVLSIISTMGSLLWTLALLVLIFYSFGVMLTQLVIDHCRYNTIESTGDTNAIPTCEPILKMYWSEVPESMLTLFMAITGGVSWDDAVRPLRDVSMLALALVIFYAPWSG
ncbi:unnamed protein product [Durusdinium trenchii]|uniref:Ion transport domain-containing protein n=1 Tax=Durusdinium trenchii TaxID=1381693 RepID=A0ABP0QFT2_9DINO